MCSFDPWVTWWVSPVPARWTGLNVQMHSKGNHAAYVWQRHDISYTPTCSAGTVRYRGLRYMQAGRLHAKQHACRQFSV